MSKNTSRRKFLKSSTKVGIATAIGGLVISACSDEENKATTNVVEGKSNKEEILYQGDTKYWTQYYKNAK